jgi:hypothetical protein
VSDNHRGLPHDLPEYVPNVPPEPEAPAEVYQVLVHGAVWGDFKSWLDGRGIKLSPPTRFSEGDLPTYVMQPKWVR